MKSRLSLVLAVLFICLSFGACTAKPDAGNSETQSTAKLDTTASSGSNNASGTSSADVESISTEEHTTEKPSERETTVSTTAKPTTEKTAKATTRATTAKTTSKATSEAVSETQSEATTSRRVPFSWLKNRRGETTTTKAAAEKPTTAVYGEDFFNDAVFVGDSVSLGLKNYATSERNNGRSCLGKAKFLCSGSLGYMNSQYSVDSQYSRHPSYQGKKVLIEDGVKLCGAKKVFIMLGMNDFSGYDDKKVVETAVKLINKILDKSPDAKIYVEGVTPIISGKEHGKFTNANISAFNAELKKMCDEHGWNYVDIASGAGFKDANGFLKKSYCGDAGSMGIHMSFAACKAWANYLVETY